MKDLTAVELEEHQAQSFHNALQDSKIYDNVLKDVQGKLEAYTTEQTNLMIEKHDINTTQGREEANKELNRLIRRKNEQLITASPEYQKVIKSVNAAVVSKYGAGDIEGSAINKKYTLEAEGEYLPIASAIRKIPLIGDAWADASHGVGVGRFQVMKGLTETNEVVGVALNVKRDRSEISDLKQRLKDGEKEGGEYIKYSNSPNFMGEKYGSQQRQVVYDGTIGGRIKELEGKIPGDLKRVQAGITSSKEYQAKISALDPAEIFDKSIFDPHVTTDEFQKMVGTQATQMLAGIFMYPTFAQEAGGIGIESTVIEAARKTFPNLSDEEAKKSFEMLGDDVQTRLMVKAIDDGEVNFTPAITFGAAAASLDVVSNFFVFAKGAKAIPMSAVKDFFKGKIKKTLTSKGAKAVYAATGVETLTESLQEGLGIAGVASATDGYMEGGEFFSEQNIKRMAEGAGQALLTTPFLTVSGKAAGTAKKEFNALVFENPKQARAMINAKKKQLDQALEDQVLTEEEHTQEMLYLESTEDVVNNTDQYSKMDPDQKQATIDLLVNRKRAEKTLVELEASQKKSDKENKNASDPEQLMFLGLGALENQKKIDDAKKELAKTQEKVFKEVYKSQYFQDAKLAQYINDSNEGTFKGKKFKRFKDKEQANAYFKEVFKNDTWLSTAEDISNTITSFVEKGLTVENAKTNAFIQHAKHGEPQVLQQILDMRRLWEGETSAAALNDNAWTIDENVMKRIDDGDMFSMNAFHHEGLHLIQNDMNIDQIMDIIIIWF